MFTDFEATKQLRTHYASMQKVHMRDLFADKKRFENFHMRAAGILLDYSKNRITSETMQLLLSMAEEANVPSNIAKLFAGDFKNVTEQRSVAHIACRANIDQSFYVDGKDVSVHVKDALQQMTEFVDAVRSGKWLGFQGDKITDIVNIGIGGSDLGPVLVTEALTPYQLSDVRCHFVSNVDGNHISQTLRKLNPATTLFIVVSKSFRTSETLRNAATAKHWLSNVLGQKAIPKHFVAVTAMPSIASAQCYGATFPFWQWVGGRFSVWSAVGLSVMFAIGPERFMEFLQGARAMDEHFRDAPLDENMPVILAVLAIWYVNFFGAQSYAILPYDQFLQRLPAYLQQAEMESNGKSCAINGEAVQYQTSPIVWGTVGCNGQHAFHQALHQGTQLVPMDFIVPLRPHHPLTEHHRDLVANCFSQSQALMWGRQADELILHYDESHLAQHRYVPGNRPSNTLLIPKLTPYYLGALLALYEHKIFVQGVIWGINSFDQWGVELGKQLANEVRHALTGKRHHALDVSTAGLIAEYLTIKS